MNLSEHAQRLETLSVNLAAFTPPISFPTNAFTHTAALTSNIVRFGVNYGF